MTIPHGLVNNFVPNTITVPVLEPSVATSAPVIPDQSIGSASQPLPVKRGRGRPRKNVVVVVDKPRRSRGRPRKNPEASSLKMPVKAASSVNRRARASKKSYPILPTSLILKDVANSSLIDQDDARLRTVYKLVLEHQLHDLPEPSKKRKSIARSDHKSPKKLATETAKKAAELASESIIPTSSESSSSSSPFTESTVGTITESVVLSSLNAEPGQQPIPSTFQAINSTDSASIASELDLFLDTLTPDDIPLADEHELSLNLDLMSSPESPGQFDVVGSYNRL